MIRALSRSVSSTFRRCDFSTFGKAFVAPTNTFQTSNFHSGSECVNFSEKLAVIAFGGNALLRSGQEGTVEDQLENCYETCKHLVPLLKDGYNIVITHGNGPQVGVELLKNEAGAGEEFGLPKFPMYMCGAETQGSIGYMIESQMNKVLLEHSIEKNVISVLTQVEVDPNDPGFANPNKPVGPYYTIEEATEMENENGWVFKEDPNGRGFRRVVPSPTPVAVNNAKIIESLARGGNIVICVGGGGIPVYRSSGIQVGVDAVIDKDLATSFLACEIDADEFMIFTDVSNVYLNFNTPDELKLYDVSTSDMTKYIEEGHFAEGSMSPKVRASVDFVKKSKSGVSIITDANTVGSGESGTTIFYEE